MLEVDATPDSWKPVITSLEMDGDNLIVTWNQPGWPDDEPVPLGGYQIWSSLGDPVKIGKQGFVNHGLMESPSIIPFKDALCVSVQAQYQLSYYRTSSATVCYDESETTAPVVSLDVDGAEFTITWQQKPHDDFVGFDARYLVETPEGQDVEDWQSLEKTCPIAQGQCGPLDITDTNGQYRHTHQNDHILRHCFEITAKFTNDVKSSTQCALTEAVSILDPKAPK